MKFTQYTEFAKLLEDNNLSLEDWKEKPGIKLIKEEGEEGEEGNKKEKALDTKKGNIVTKRGRMRKTLNKQAKKLQEQINKNLVAKYFEPIFKQKTGTYKKMAELLAEKQPKEVIAELGGELKGLRGQVKKQLDVIEKAANQFIKNYTTKIDSAIDKKGLKEGTSTDLKTYWILLTTQIQMQLLQSISKKDDTLLDEIIQDPKIRAIATKITKQINQGVTDKVNGLAGSIKEQKTQLQAADNAATKPEEEKPVEVAAEA